MTRAQQISMRNRVWSLIAATAEELLNGPTPAVLGAGVHCQTAGEECVRLYMNAGARQRRKEVLRTLKNAGVPIEAVLMTPLRAFTGTAQPCGGIQVRNGNGRRRGEIGTLGAVLIDGLGDRWALTANHVIFGGRAARIMDRNVFAVDENADATLIGSEIRHAPLIDGGRLDCAMVKAKNNATLDPAYPDELRNLRAQPTAPRPGAKVSKIGRTMREMKTANVHDRLATVTIHFPEIGLFALQDAILIADANSEDGIREFAAVGDSGSVVFQKVRNRLAPMGIVVGGPNTDLDDDGRGEDFVAVCSFADALKALDAQLEEPRRGLQLMLPGDP
jgi:hypothetical protein